MILDEATHEKFGYWPSDLKPQSNKCILAVCDDCGKVRILQRYSYRSLCKSCVLKGNARCLGCKHTDEAKALISKAMKGNRNCLGHTLTEEHKANICAGLKGNINSLGYKHTEEQNVQKSAVMKGRTGDKNANWRGGISFEPYCVKFNNTFKEYIRSKFEYKCFLCHTTQTENGRRLSVHHVNYNKNCGCDGDKTCFFVPLCKSCHTKTNGKREYWQKIITDKLHCMIIGWDI